MIKIVQAKDLTSKQLSQLHSILQDGWESPKQVMNSWQDIIETYCFIIEKEQISAVGSWAVHELKDKNYDIGIYLALFAVSKNAQGRGFGTKITLLSFLYSFKQVQKKYGLGKRLLYWGVSANPIVIQAYLKNFPFYITPNLDGTYDKSYISVGRKLVSWLDKEQFISTNNPFLLKKCVKHSFTQKEIKIQKNYIKKLGSKFNVDLKVEDNDRLLIILGSFSTPFGFFKLYPLYLFLSFKKLFKL